jgi:hypothetical protein
MRPHFVVVSTAFNAPTEAKCRASVLSQEDVGIVEHRYINAGAQPKPEPVVVNLMAMIEGLPKETIVVWLDGDDWLSSSKALATIATIYEEKPETWLTYGQYVHADGRPGHCQPYGMVLHYDTKWRELEGVDWDPSPRYQPWFASHLKTFRAGLFHRIELDDFKLGNLTQEWIELAVDLAVMFPMLEMAGPERVVFNPNVVHVYNDASSFEHRASQRELLKERAVARAIRAKRPYDRIEAL